MRSRTRSRSIRSVAMFQFGGENQEVETALVDDDNPLTSTRGGQNGSPFGFTMQSYGHKKSASNADEMGLGGGFVGEITILISIPSV